MLVLGRKPCILVLFFVCEVYCKAALTNNGYENVLIAISPEEVEDPPLIEKITELVTKASDQLYIASRKRAYFKSVTILIPQSWNVEADAAVSEIAEDAEILVSPPNPVYGHNPYTVQNGECGEPGGFTHLTSWFVRNHANNASQEYGRTEKILVHEWAKQRWGVYEEYGYPGDEIFPMFYLQTSWGPNGQVTNLKPNFCTTSDVLGKAKDVFTGQNCTYDSYTGLPDNHCYFFPDPSNKMSSSYMALPFLDSVTDFCDQTEDNLHHAENPTKQNFFCEGKSTWEVIEKNEDFANGANPTNPNIINTVPIFKTVQSQSQKYVVVMDISTSMQTGPDPIHSPELYGKRANALKDAVKRWIMYEVQDGTEVALVAFSDMEPSMNPIIHKMEAVNDISRPNMIQSVDNLEFYGFTCIGCGLDRSLNWPGALKGLDGGVVILITDGEQNCGSGNENNPKCLTIDDMMPQVLARSTRVVTIAFGLDADTYLEELALKSGGKSYFIDDYSGPGTINDAFTGSLTYQPGDVLGNTNTVVLQKDYFNVTEGVSLRDFFDIDQSIGRDVSFQVEIRNGDSNCSAPVKISLLRPDAHHTPELDEEDFTCSSSNFRMYRHKLSGIAETGRWVYKLSPEQHFDSLSVKVESKARNTNMAPVMTKCWVSTGNQEVDTSTDVKLAVIAEVSQGSKPVVGAKILAEIERPSTDETNPPIILELKDNGSGADKIKNDGTYSRHFAKYTGKGRYSVKCQVYGDDETNINGGFSGSKVFPQIPDAHTPLCCGSDAMPSGSITTPTGNFTRQSAGGSFQVPNAVDPNEDTFPPGRVTDLKVTNFLSRVAVSFTSPGNDFDSDEEASEYILKFSSTIANLTGDNFDKDEFNKRITAENIVGKNSDLDPIPGGETKIIYLRIDTFPSSGHYVLAMRAKDDVGNKSPVSNHVQVFVKDQDLFFATNHYGKPR